MEVVLAGHAQPVVVRADGTAELIGRFGTALGLFQAVDLHCTRHVLAAGETLLLYTDGVTERRRGDEQFGVERLRRAGGAAAGRPAARLLTVVRAALGRFTASPHDDDIALLALRAEPSA
jgi:serine phosphatase RsbU (regulator of sigma subunit)